MKKFILIITIFLLTCDLSAAQTAAPSRHRRFSLAAGVSRSSPFSKTFSRRQFSLSLAVGVSLTKRLSLNFGISEPLDLNRPVYRTGINLKIF